MRKIGLFYVALLVIVGLLSKGSLAQDYTQWHLTEGATVRLGKGSINDMEFSPDDSRLAVATDIGIWIYDAHTGAEISFIIVKSTNKFTFSEIYVSVYDYGLFNRFTQTRARFRQYRWQ